MNSISRWRPSSSSVVSFVALFVALSGTAVALKANSVGSKQLKPNAVKSKHVDDGAVQGRDVRNKSLTGVDVGNGTLTGADVGSNSLTGADIAEGTLTQVPLAGKATSLTFVQTVTTFSANDATDFKSVTAACTAGRKVIGGGARLIGGGSGNVALFQSYPGNNSSWTAHAHEVNATGTSWQLTAYAICGYHSANL